MPDLQSELQAERLERERDRATHAIEVAKICADRDHQIAKIAANAGAQIRKVLGKETGPSVGQILISAAILLPVIIWLWREALGL